ncbi:MAG: hypothetical protein NT062_25560 [Proteobacteria bacterium]|nr:hypothetical protein [Pseudomonadota bacterium]
MRRLQLFTLSAVLAACGKPAEEAQPTAAEGSTRKLAGVWPSDFKCSSIITDEAVGTLLGGKATSIGSPSSVPRGLAHPCAYELVTATGPEYWTYDFDCRPDYKKQADILFTQYAKTSAELVAAYNAEADAGIKPSDAGVQRAPEVSAVVDVGAKGLDHHGQGLIFIDDDAPCYVRVVGPDAPRRLELSKTVAKNLTFANAPMSPRPFP